MSIEQLYWKTVWHRAVRRMDRSAPRRTLLGGRIPDDGPPTGTDWLVPSRRSGVKASSRTPLESGWTTSSESAAPAKFGRIFQRPTPGGRRSFLLSVGKARSEARRLRPLRRFPQNLIPAMQVGSGYPTWGVAGFAATEPRCPAWPLWTGRYLSRRPGDSSRRPDSVPSKSCSLPN